MTTFNEVRERYMLTFKITEEDLKDLAEGKEVLKYFSSCSGRFPYTINGADHEIEYDRVENGARVFELNVTSASDGKEEKALGWMVD